MFSDELRYRAFELLGICRGKGLRLATAESCTGGLIAALLTDIPGSSDVFERGFVTYSNLSKTEMLGVPAELIAMHGAVSPEAAESMARSARVMAGTQLAVAVTGIAGPGGGLPHKPVGLVYICVAHGETLHTERNYFIGNRSGVRMQTVEKALSLLQASV